MAIAYKPFKSMKMNTSKERSFYTQGQQFVARVLFILWLLASGSPEGVLAVPKHQMVPATTTSPGDPSLASAPPTPLPGGAFQLPPEAPGAFWGDSAGSIPSMDAALQRASSLRARTLDKLADRLWRPRTQETLRTPAGPVAEGDEAGSSSSQHPAVDSSSAVATSRTATPNALHEAGASNQQSAVDSSSAVATSRTATPNALHETGSSSQQLAVDPSDVVDPSSAVILTLEELMSQKDVPDNDTLLAALNATPPKTQRQWIEAALSWFDDMSIVKLPAAAIRDYASLAHIQVTPKNSELLKRYFNSLCNKVKDGSFGEELLIQALAYVLAHLDPAVFNQDATSLFRLAGNLLEKLQRSENSFTQKTYPTARITLEALFQTLFLAQKIAPAPGQLEQKERSLYQNFSNQLTDLAKVQYYPVKYHAQILKQTLELLSKTEEISQHQQVWKLCQAVLRPKFESNENHWYSWLLQICDYSAKLLEGDASYCTLLVRYLEFQKGCLKAQQGLRVFKPAVKKAEKALRFGIAMQLQSLALLGPTPEVRKAIIEQLSSLAQPEAWGSDADVLAGLLDGLALVAVQSQPDRVAEAAMAREALEALVDELKSPPARQPWHLGRLFHSPIAPQEAASSALNQWLERETLSSKLQRLREKTAQPTPADQERLLSHVKRTLKQTATTESWRAQEINNLPRLTSYILIAKLSHFVERIAITEQLSDILSDKGVCVLHGFGGAGKSTLAAHYGHGRKATQTVRWIGAENSSKLKEGYEQLAQELQVAYQPLAKKLAADASQYRQELARMVYDALEKSSQPTLLILDNAQDASLVADYMLHRPDAIQAIITTRSAEAFEGTYEQLQLGAFSQGEGEDYLEVRLKKMKRAYTPHEVVSLLEEVGLVAQKLNLAAGYLQANKLVKAAQYIARLQALKQAGTKQQGKLTLPEVALGLETLTKEGQQLMQYAAYLDADFIPFSLVSVLLGEEDPEQLSEVASDLSRLSLMQVVSTNEGQELGLQVHREVQASCREYKDWCAEAALGTRDTILLQLARVLKAQMPFVASAPDDSWQQARLYAPHVTTVVTSLEDSGAVPSAVVAELLELMGAYSKQVGLNYRQSVSFYERSLAMKEQVYQETPNHLSIASTLNNLGSTWGDLGEAHQAVSFLERALAILEQIYQETPNHPAIATTLVGLGNAWGDLGDGRQAVSFLERALAIFEQVYQETPNHPEIARTLNNLGLAYSDLGDANQAVSFYKRALAIDERVYKETPNHPHIARTLNNLGIAYSDLGDANQAVSFLERSLAIYEQVYKETPNHPHIARTLGSLGTAYRDLGDAKQAVSFYKRALAIREQVYKETSNHPHIARTLNNLGNAYRDLGDAKQAVSFYKRSLAIYEQVYKETPNHPEIARTLNNLGLAYSDLGDANQAFSFYKRALAIDERVYKETPNHPHIARTLNNLGNAYRALGDAKQAVSFYKRALAIDEQVYKETPNHPEIAGTLNNLGIAYSDLGDAKQAVSFYKRALAIDERVYKETPNHPHIARTLNNLGNAYSDLGDAKQAVSFYKRALAIDERVYKETPNHPHIARTLNNLGIAYSDLGDAKQAVNFYKRSLAIREQVYKETPYHPEIARTLGSLGNTYRALGDANQSVSFYKRTLAIREQVYKETPYHPEIARTLNNLGTAYSDLGDANQSVSFYKRALEMKEQVYKETPNHPEIARTLNNLGNAYSDLGDANQSVSFLERALAIYEQVYKETPNHPHIARTLGSLGTAYSDLGDANQAVSFYKRALAIREQVYKETFNHPEIAMTLNNLGKAYSDLGDANQAVSFYKRALAIYEQVYKETPNHPEIARTLNNLGNAYRALGDANQAVSFLERSLAIRKQVYKETPNHPEIAGTLNNLGLAYSDLGDANQAVSFYKRALAIDERVYKETPYHPHIARTLNNLGLAYSDLGDANQAVSFYKRALAIDERVYKETPYHPHIARTLNNLGLAYSALGDANQAVSFYKRALAIYEQVYKETPYHPEIAMTLNNLGAAYSALGDANQAVSFYKRALAIYEQVYKETPYHPEIAMTLGSLGNTYRALGDANQAVSFYKRALAIYEQVYKETPYHPEIAMTLNNLGAAYSALGDANQAVSYLERALAIRKQVYKETPYHPEIASTLNNLGAAYSALGDGNQAGSYYERALAIFEQSYKGTPYHPEIAMTLMGLGNAYRDLGDANQAVSFLERALAIFEQSYKETPNHPEIASTLRNLGIVYEQKLNDYSKALEYYQKVLAMQQALHEGENHAEVADSLRTVGVAYERLGNYEQSLEYYQQALQMQQVLHEGENHVDVAQLLSDVGDAYKGLGQHEQSLECYQQALTIQQVLHEGENHADVAQAFYAVGVVYGGLGRLEEAIQHYEQALAVPAASPDTKASTGHNLGCMYHVKALAVRQEGNEQQAQAYLDKATASFEQAIQASEGVRVGLYTAYGDFLLATEKPAQAHNYLCQAIESGDNESELQWGLLEQPIATPVLQAYISQQQKVQLRGIDYAYYLMIHHYEDFQKAGIAMDRTKEEYLAAYQASLDQCSGLPGQTQTDKTAYYMLESSYEAQGDHEVATTAFARSRIESQASLLTKACREGDKASARNALKAYYQQRFFEVRSFFPADPTPPMAKIQYHLMLREQIKVKEKFPKDPDSQVAAIHELLTWTKTPISPQDLFKPRSIKPGEPAKEIHKVLLIGKAGAGKTTLGHRLAHDWAQGKWGKTLPPPICSLSITYIRTNIMKLPPRQHRP